MCNLIIDDNANVCRGEWEREARGQRLIDLERTRCGGEREREGDIETDRNGLAAHLIPLIDQFLYDSNPASA